MFIIAQKWGKVKEGHAFVDVEGTIYSADGTKLSSADCYAKNGDSNVDQQELKAGEYILVTEGTFRGYVQSGGEIPATCTEHV